MKREYFNDLAARWDSLPSPPDLALKAGRFVERARVDQARRILDLGCGTGILVGELLSAHPSLIALVEADFAHAMLRENAAKHRDGRVYRVCADANAPPFPDASFDLVLCFGVLPHLGDARTALERLWRLLAPGGALAVGHLMGSDQLNAFHASLGGPVASDYLPPAPRLAQALRLLGAARVTEEEGADWYLVRAEREAR